MLIADPSGKESGPGEQEQPRTLHNTRCQNEELRADFRCGGLSAAHEHMVERLMSVLESALEALASGDLGQQLELVGLAAGLAGLIEQFSKELFGGRGILVVPKFIEIWEISGKVGLIARKTFLYGVTLSH